MGPVEIAKGFHKHGIFDNVKGVILPEVEAEYNMKFTPLLVSSGDFVFFSSSIPHRSNKNVTQRHRRLAYLTYNPLSQGDHHEAYYSAKKKSFADGSGGTISINDDFKGNIVK